MAIGGFPSYNFFLSELQFRELGIKINKDSLPPGLLVANKDLWRESSFPPRKLRRGEYMIASHLVFQGFLSNRHLAFRMPS